MISFVVLVFFDSYCLRFTSCLVTDPSQSSSSFFLKLRIASLALVVAWDLRFLLVGSKSQLITADRCWCCGLRRRLLL